MRILACFFSLFFCMQLASPVVAQINQPGDPVILAPRPGDVLQGVVTISGSSDLNGFVSAEVTFTYADDPTGTWFLIGLNNHPVLNDKLATWDTTVITDGNYVLRLRVTLDGGSTRETIVSGLRVRNYNSVETPTPFPTVPEATPVPTSTPTTTPYPTPTVLPLNPATIVPTDVTDSVLYGGLAAISTFVLIGIYLWVRRKIP